MVTAIRSNKSKPATQASTMVAVLKANGTTCCKTICPLFRFKKKRKTKKKKLFFCWLCIWLQLSVVVRDDLLAQTKFLNFVKNNSLVNDGIWTTKNIRILPSTIYLPLIKIHIFSIFLTSRTELNKVPIQKSGVNNVFCKISIASANKFSCKHSREIFSSISNANL